MRYSFPLAFAANTFAMTVLLIALGLTGHRVLAAEVGVVQAATLALLYAFSANARSLILNKASGVSAYSVMVGRLALLLPLMIASYWLSVNVAGVDWLLAVILILRRCVEWIGEVHLSEMERQGRQSTAKYYFALQAALLGILLIWVVGSFPLPLLGLFIWAALPVVYSIRFIVHLLTKASNPLHGVVKKMLPNLGSTAIIGITVYVFRILIVLATDKETAGDLFTAFAIGGMTGSVFANAFGATVALHEQDNGESALPPILRHTRDISMLVGLFIFAAAFEKMSFLAITGKSFFFWEAAGLSMIGGGIMVFAQQIRFRLLQHDGEHDVFGPDVLMNILMFASVPFIFYLYGRDALVGLFLINAVMAYVFYRSAKIEKLEDSGIQSYSPLVYQCLRIGIAGLMLLPMFFQLGHGLFNNTSSSFDSGGTLLNLPIPVSVLTCYLGILLLGTYRRAFISFMFIFGTCVLMVMSSIILTQGLPISQQSKFLLLIQYVLPMFALVLGQVYEPANTTVVHVPSYAKAFFWILFVAVPVQLVFTWIRGLGYLSPRLGLFSVYQFLQYVPVIFACSCLLTLFSLWHLAKYKAGLIWITAFMAVYVAASLSMLAMSIFFLGMLIFAWTTSKLKREKIPIVMVFFAMVLSIGYFQYEKNLVAFKFGFLNGAASAQADNASVASGAPEVAGGPGVFTPEPVTSEDPQDSGSRASTWASIAHEVIPPNLSGRLRYWRYYIDGLTKNFTSFMFGAIDPPVRTRYPSAHNYYLDFAYNFGVVSLLPMFFLMGFTGLQVFKKRHLVLLSPTMLSLTLVVAFLLLIDNVLKVSLRQPYTGMFTFFIWGILITKITRIQKT